MRRIGAKGEGRFERISWDDALDTISRRFREIADSGDGPEAILPFSYGGTMGIVNSGSMDRRFFHRLGASKLARTICSSAGGEAIDYTLGAKIGTDMENFHRARLIVLWGTNTLTSNIHLWPQIKQAVDNGAKLIGIDPYRNHTLDHCHQFIQVRPGTDAALALAMMNVIIGEGLGDHDYIDRYTIGFDKLRERAAEFPPSRAAEICGVPEDEIVSLAREYATTRPAVIRINYGLQRHAGGGMAVRAVACLPALTGSWRDAGGGVLLSSSGMFKYDEGVLQRPDLARANPRTINMTRLGEALTEAKPPVKAIYVYNSNPAAIAPDQSKVLEGFSREDLFTVVHEQFQTDTADYADILLPATTQLEHRDMVKPYGHYYLVYSEPAIAPLGEAKPNWEVFQLLAARMGFEDQCFNDTDEDIIRQALATDYEPLKGITLDRLKQDGWARLNLAETFAPFAEGGFLTPSGKCEFYSEAMERAGLDPLPAYIPPRESPATAPDLSSRYPLQLICPPANSFLNTTFSQLPSFLKSERQPFIQLHAEDADRRESRTATRFESGTTEESANWWLG